MPARLTVHLDPEWVFRRTLLIIATLVAASLFAAFLRLNLGHSRVFGLSEFVHLDREKNLPTMFSLVQLVAASGAAWFLGTKEPVRALRSLWRFLSVGLMWIGLDDATMIHENANRIDLGSWRKISYFHFAWVVPASVVVALCGAILLKLLRTLPRRTAAMFALSGTLFVAGAVGVEMLGAHQARLGGQATWSYTLCYTVEEMLEMLGPALFIRTALRHAITGQTADAETAAEKSQWAQTPERADLEHR